MNIFQFFITCKRTYNTNNATHYVKLGTKGRESSKLHSFSKSDNKSNHHHLGSPKVKQNSNYIQVVSEKGHLKGKMNMFKESFFQNAPRIM